MVLNRSENQVFLWLQMIRMCWWNVIKEEKEVLSWKYSNTMGVVTQESQLFLPLGQVVNLEIHQIDTIEVSKYNTGKQLTISSHKNLWYLSLWVSDPTLQVFNVKNTWKNSWNILKKIYPPYETQCAYWNKWEELADKICNGLAKVRIHLHPSSWGKP